MQKLWSKNYVVFILGLMYVATLSINLTKAVQIDDTAYLEVARAVIHNPLHPLSQTINWHNTQEPIFTINQPPFLSYFLALILVVGGGSELVLHLAWSIFSLAAIVAFYLLAEPSSRPTAMFLTGLFVLSPGFMPGQNLMFDIPLMAVWLLFFLALLSARSDPGGRKYFLAACCMTIALLIKYSSLVLPCVFIITVLYRRDWKALAYLALPFGALALWSISNYFDYGAIHILGRTINPGAPVFALMKRFIAITAGLGLVSPFAALFMMQKRPGRTQISWLCGAALLGLAVFFLAIRDDQSKTTAAMWALLCFAGSFAFFFLPYSLYKGMRVIDSEQRRQASDRNLVLGLWVVGTSAFLVLFASDLSIRHIFMMLPPILLWIGGYLENHGTHAPTQVIVLVLTAALALSISISDYDYAGIYRDAATLIKSSFPQRTRLWQLGHWGWQWYAMKQGMLQYDTVTTRLQPGDYLVIPAGVDQQQITDSDGSRLQDFETIQVAAPAATWIRTMYPYQVGGYYSFNFPTVLPIEYSREPFTFTIKRVTEK